MYGVLRYVLHTAYSSCSSIQSRLSFDTCWLENIGERIVVETVGNRITPLVLNPGRVLLTNERLYFQVVIVLIES